MVQASCPVGRAHARCTTPRPLLPTSEGGTDRNADRQRDRQGRRSPLYPIHHHHHQCKLSRYAPRRGGARWDAGSTRPCPPRAPPPPGTAPAPRRPRAGRSVMVRNGHRVLATRDGQADPTDRRAGLHAPASPGSLWCAWSAASFLPSFLSATPRGCPAAVITHVECKTAGMRCIVCALRARPLWLWFGLPIGTINRCMECAGASKSVISEGKPRSIWMRIQNGVERRTRMPRIKNTNAASIHPSTRRASRGGRTAGASIVARRLSRLARRLKRANRLVACSKQLMPGLASS